MAARKSKSDRPVRKSRGRARSVTSPVMPKTGFGRLRAYLVTGIIVTAPFAITIYLALLIIDFVDDNVKPMIPERYNPDTYLPFAVPGLGLIIVVLFLVFVGWMARGLVGRLMLRYSERIMAQMPVLRSVYTAAKQIFETVMSQQSSAFRQVVLVQYPHKGVWVLGFITGDPGPEVQSHTDDEVIGVMVPTTPNPTSGYLLYYPVQDVVYLSMSVEEAMKIIISMGIVGADADKNGLVDVAPPVGGPIGVPDAPPAKPPGAGKAPQPERSKRAASSRSNK